MQAQFDVRAASYEDACDMAVDQAMEMEPSEWGTTELLGGPRPASCLKVVELSADLLDDLLGRAEALAQTNIRTDIFEDDGRRDTATGCTECMRYNRGEIEHAASCVTGRLLAMTGQLRTLQARHAVAAKPHVVCEYCGDHCYGGAAHNQRVEAGDRFDDPPRQPVSPAAERRVVCGEEITDAEGQTYCCDVEPEHGGWHIDKGRGKAWPTLTAWPPTQPPVVDAREIGVLG